MTQISTNIIFVLIRAICGKILNSQLPIFNFLTLCVKNILATIFMAV